MADEIAKVLDERTATYGSFADNALLTDMVLTWLRGSDPHPDVAVEEAAHMVAHKAARIIVGGITGDSHVDMKGYLRLIPAYCAPHPKWAIELREKLSTEEAEAVLGTLKIARRAFRNKDPLDVAAVIQESGV